MSDIAFYDDNGNAYYAQPEGGYGTTDPSPPAPAAGDWWTNAPYINQTPYKLNPNTGKPELIGTAKIPAYLGANGVQIYRGEQVPESIAKSMGVQFVPYTLEQFQAPKNDFDIGGALLLGGLGLFAAPALASALGAAGAAGATGAGALEGLTAADIFAGMDLAGTAAGAELGIGGAGVLAPSLINQAGISAAEAATTGLPEAGLGSLIDQAALDQAGAGLLSGESAGVAVSPLTDVGTVSATELPVTQTVADSGLGSIADQATLQAVTDAANVDLAGIGQQGWEALPGTTPYVDQALVDAINSANLTDATNVDLAGVGEQGWNELPGTTPYQEIPQAPSLIDQEAIKAAETATPAGNATDIDLTGIGRESWESLPGLTPYAGRLWTLSDLQNIARDISRALNVVNSFSSNPTSSGSNIFGFGGRSAGQSASSSGGAYDDPSKRPFLSPTFLSTGSPLQNVVLPGVDPRLMSQLVSRGYEVNAATGGSINPSRLVPGPEGRYYAKHDHRGFSVGGPGTGQSDDIPTMLSDGEYVIDADTVAALGDGSSKAGASVLDKFREEIRKHKRSAPVDDIPPKAKSPLQYLKMAHKGKHHD